MISLLFVGDVVGRPGRTILTERLGALRERLGVDFVVANGENAAAGAGITGKIARELFAAGVDAITLGDHVWDQKSFDLEIGTIEGLCRPANLPKGCPGRDRLVIERNGKRLGVFTVLGRNFMGIKADCPFLESQRLVGEMSGTCDAILAEVHMEATSEKIAMGWFLDGRVAAVLGTHTHVPTADARVLPKGTAYLTDVGMTGPYESVLGREIEPVVSRFLDGLPRRFGVASGDVRISGALVRYDPEIRRATSCELVTEFAEPSLRVEDQDSE